MLCYRQNGRYKANQIYADLVARRGEMRFIMTELRSLYAALNEALENEEAKAKELYEADQIENLGQYKAVTNLAAEIRGILDAFENRLDFG